MGSLFFFLQPKRLNEKNKNSNFNIEGKKGFKATVAFLSAFFEDGQNG